MKEIYTGVLSSIISLLLIAAILTPSFVKLSHALYEHQETECQEIGSVHVHDVEFECDFQKFKLSSQYYPNFVNNLSIDISIIKEKDFNFYSFLSKYQKLHFTLRGPPAS